MRSRGGITLEMGLGSRGGTSWGMEKAGFSEARLTGPRQQPLWFERHVWRPFWRRGGITLEMGLGSPGGTSWEMEKTGFGEARVGGAGQQLLMLRGHLAAPAGRWKKLVFVKHGLEARSRNY